MTPEGKEIAELRGKPRKIEMEKDILKKALHIIFRNDR